jgi:radical SAM superfamily enzyme YgiQ (UPF0313 family)
MTLSGRIALVNSNRCSEPYPVFPLGIAHLAAFLEKGGMTAELFDVSVDGHDLEDRVSRFNPDYVGISMRNIDDLQIHGPVLFAPFLRDVTGRLKTAVRVPVILGGSGYSLFPEQLLDMCGADYGITGEAENALAMLIERLAAKRPVDDVPGLVYRSRGFIKINAKKSIPPADISTPSIPPRLADYYCRSSSMLNVQTQRGCAFKCCYCTYPVIEGRRLRLRPAADVCTDIAAMRKAGAEYVFLVDSVFNTSHEHVQEICGSISRSGIKIKWGCFLRPSGLTQEMLNVMAAAGCTHIEFGTDSLCDKVLDAYGKGFTFDDVAYSSSLALKAKIHYSHFLILGGPGENEKTLAESFVNSKRIQRTVFFPFIGMRIYPGTSLYDCAVKEGYIGKDTDLLAPKFYISPALTEKKIRAMLDDLRQSAPNWIVGDIPEGNQSAADMLRKKGISGPLWEFLIR